MEPVHTKGNAFWRGDERFLIRGISYVPHYRRSEGEPKPDFLAEDRLHDLKRDIEIFRELGLNTIQVSRLDPSNSHEKALELLKQAGIYVLVELFEDVTAPNTPSRKWSLSKHRFDTAPCYPFRMLKEALKIVDEFMHHPNLLGFMVCGDAISSPAFSEIAEVSRAAVADVKKFLRLRGTRYIPVGVRVKHILVLKLCTLQYFTAGPQDERVDFFAPECWSWPSPSNFQISGWMTTVDSFAKYPVPMFLGAYGTKVNARIWDEVECLYSPDMTWVFSGGCFYTYFEYGNNYGIVKSRDDGTVERKPEFEFLKERFNAVNVRNRDELYLADIKDYESWTGEFPWIRKNRWYASWEIPRFSGSWEHLLEELEDEKEWVLIEEVILPGLSK